jgi:hypothetical protein
MIASASASARKPEEIPFNESPPGKDNVGLVAGITLITCIFIPKFMSLVLYITKGSGNGLGRARRQFA